LFAALLLFTKSFYQNLKEQEEENSVNDTPGAQKVLNLANAMRHACLDVMSQRKDPYSWTAFVLQEAGFFFC